MNLVPLIAAAIAGVAAGAIWYSPYLFGRAWMKSVGLTEQSARKRGMALPMISSIVAALLLAFVLQRAQVNLQQMMTVVVLLWLVFCVALRLPHYLFEGRSLRSFFIYAGHDLVQLVVIGAIVTLWR